MTTAPSPHQRILRTALQVILGALVAVPTAVGALHLSAHTATAVIGISGAIVVMVSAMVNAYDHSVGNG